MLPLLPIAAAAGIAAAGFAVHKRSKGKKLDAKHQQLFDKAYQTLKPPESLRRLADEFEKRGYKTHAELLRKRAQLREMSPETRKAHKAVIRKAYNSKNHAAILRVAKSFRKMGALGTAHNLEAFAKSVKANANVPRPAHRAGRPPTLRRPS